jgi:hypothetical protein
MRFALTADHREFFVKNNYIELEGLLSADQIATLKKNTDEALAARLRIQPRKLMELPASELFQAGYDLWRDNDEIKKTVHKNTLATLASELFQAVPLRCAFDQSIYTTQRTSSVFPEPYALEQTSCLSPLAGALILPLEDLMEPLSFFPVPVNRGNGLFISPSLPIPWPKLCETPGLRLLMIGYGMGRTFFRPDTRDPHAVNLKKQGYVFNDALKNSTHPVLLYKSP